MADALGAVKSIVRMPSLGQTGPMRWVFVIGMCLGLAACAPLTIYHQPGIAVAQMEDDRLDCAVAALRDAPVATEIRRIPPVYVPARHYCDSAGNCYVRGGYWERGEVYTVDVNRPLRRQLRDRCMALKGYRPVSIPICPQSVKDAAPTRATTTLPPLSDKSCAIRNADDTWQIVNRG